MLKKFIVNLENCIPRCKLPQGSLKLSFVVVLLIGVPLSMTISLSRTVIFLLLMTSGDVERNPGPENLGTSTVKSLLMDSEKNNHYTVDMPHALWD